jgi:hypothetical protein
MESLRSYFRLNLELIASKYVINYKIRYNLKLYKFLLYLQTRSHR